MKILGIVLALAFLTGCSKTMAVSTWNAGMAFVAPGSYYTAYNSGKQIVQQMEQLRKQ